MIGTTNSINQNIIQPINNVDNLVIWLDGTDFVNHGTAGNNTYSITNGNNFNELIVQTVAGKEVSTYYKKAAANRDNGIKITPASLLNYSSLTMMAWGMRTGNNNHQNLFTCGVGSNSFVEVRLRYQTTNSISFYLPSGTSYAVNDLAVGMGLETWGHLAVVLNGSTQKMYYNGVLIKELTVTHTRNTIDFWNVLGGTAWNDTGGPGYCTDYRYYNIALTDSDIAEIYAAGPQQHI